MWGQVVVKKDWDLMVFQWMEDERELFSDVDGKQLSRAKPWGRINIMGHHQCNGPVYHSPDLMQVLYCYIVHVDGLKRSSNMWR